MKYTIYSENNDKSSADGTGFIYSKWKLLKFILKNPFNKLYKDREKLLITLYNEKIKKEQ